MNRDDLRRILSGFESPGGDEEMYRAGIDLIEEIVGRPCSAKFADLIEVKDGKYLLAKSIDYAVREIADLKEFVAHLNIWSA